LPAEKVAYNDVAAAPCEGFAAWPRAQLLVVRLAGAVTAYVMTGKKPITLDPRRGGKARHRTGTALGS
jgi:hypothetical protein